MQNVPKIVRERLQAAPSAGAHPDADVLTAFAECSLTEVEREVVLEHVARCGECRDVIALALPETETALPAAVPARTPWLTWPGLRWGLACAGVVAVVWFGVLQYSRPERSNTMLAKATVANLPAPSETKVEPATPSGQNERDKNSSPDSSSSGADRPLAVPKSELKAQTLQPVPTVSVETYSSSVRSRGKSIGGPVPPGLRMPLQLQQNAANVNGSDAPAVEGSALAKQRAGDVAANKVPMVSETVEVRGASAQFDRLDDKQTAQTPAAAQPLPADEESRVGKAKALPGTSGGAMQLTANAPAPMAVPSVEMGAVALTPPPRWTIGAAGELQRSFDQGNTWQDVDVNAASAPASSSYSVEMAAPARARKKDAEKKSQKREASAPAFRAVAASGTEIWAGGSGGALYHSRDAGTRWTRVALVSSGTPLTGDIVSVEFSDADHGRITTSTGEVWTTSDAGQTWEKQ